MSGWIALIRSAAIDRILRRGPGTMSERSIFLGALEFEDPAERAAYLERACAGDSALRQQVEQLLNAHEHPQPFMNHPAAALVATVDEPISELPGMVIGS